MEFENKSMYVYVYVCGSEDEDTVHFLTACLSLTAIAVDHVTFTHTLLDSIFAASEGIISLDDIPQWELYTRTVCFYLHTHRSRLLEQYSQPAAPI